MFLQDFYDLSETKHVTMMSCYIGLTKYLFCELLLVSVLVASICAFFFCKDIPNMFTCLSLYQSQLQVTLNKL